MRFREKLGPCFKNYLLQEEIRKDLEKETQLKLELEQRHSEDETYVEPGKGRPRRKEGLEEEIIKNCFAYYFANAIFFIFILSFNVNFVQELYLCTLCKPWIL